MKQQNYSNHIRYYTAHHFIFYPAISAVFTASLVLGFLDEVNRLLWFFISILAAFIALLSLMLRQHYALFNQNRIVRLELRFRYYVLTHRRFEEIEQRLSPGQIYALRFAPDEEFPTLVERAVQQNLSADEIKRSIKNWLPDDRRV